MSKPQNTNIAMLIDVASHLGWLLDRIVFVGGVTTELMLSDNIKRSIRPTKDVDVIVEVASNLGYAKIEQEMRAHGFSPRAEEGDPICRWLIGETVVDLMPVDAKVLGFSNRWYPEVVANPFLIEIKDGLIIRVISPPYFLATKIEAFLGRGQGDFLESHDIEDIIMVLNGRPELVKEIGDSADTLKAFLAEHFKKFMNNLDFSDAILWCLPGDAANQARHAIIISRIQEIIKYAND